MNPTPNEGQVVVGIVTVGKKILLGEVREENRVSFGNVRFIFPGGKVEAGETLEQAVIREIEEEVGIKVSDVKYLAARIHPLTHKPITYFVCDYKGELPKEPNPENADIARLVLVEKENLIKAMPTIFPKVLEYFGVNIEAESNKTSLKKVN